MNHQYKERAESERSEHYHSFRNQEEAKAEVWSWHSHKSLQKKNKITEISFNISHKSQGRVSLLYLEQDSSHDVSVHALRLKLHQHNQRHELGETKNLLGSYEE